MSPEQITLLQHQALANARKQLQADPAQENKAAADELDDFDEQAIDLDNWSAAEDY